MGCEPAPVFNWIYTRLGNVAFSLSRADMAVLSKAYLPLMWTLNCLGTSGSNYLLTQRHIPEERNALNKSALRRLQLSILWFLGNYKTRRWGEVCTEFYENPAVGSIVRPLTENTDGRTAEHTDMMYLFFL